MHRLLEELVEASASNHLGSRNFFQAFPLLILFTHLRPVAHPNDQYLLTPFLPNLVFAFFIKFFYTGFSSVAPFTCSAGTGTPGIVLGRNSFIGYAPGFASNLYDKRHINKFFNF